MANRQQQRLRMEMMTTGAIRDKHHSLLAITRLRIPLRALSKLSPAPHLLLRKDCNPSGTRDFLMEDLDLPHDQNNIKLHPWRAR